MSAIHVADTGLFVVFGQPTNSKYRAVRSFAEGNGIVIVLPEQVYNELTNDNGIEPSPIETMIEEATW